MSEPYSNQRASNPGGDTAAPNSPSPLTVFCKRLEHINNEIQNVESRVNTVLEQIAGQHKDEIAGATPESPGPGYGGYLQDVHRCIDAVEKSMASLIDRMGYLEQL